MESIYLKRGETLIIRATFLDTSGSPIVLNNSWTVSSGMRAKGTCGEVIDLAPTIDNGAMAITYATDNLDAPCYEIDLIAKQTNRTISDTFQLNLTATITPLT
jgi:hypothetical protein